MHAANALSHLQQTTPQLMVIGVHELVLHGRCTWQIAVKGTEMGTQCLSLSLKRDPPRSRHNIRKLTKRHLWQQISLIPTPGLHKRLLQLLDVRGIKCGCRPCWSRVAERQHCRQQRSQDRLTDPLGPRLRSLKTFSALCRVVQARWDPSLGRLPAQGFLLLMAGALPPSCRPHVAPHKRHLIHIETGRGPYDGLQAQHLKRSCT